MDSQTAKRSKRGDELIEFCSAYGLTPLNRLRHWYKDLPTKFQFSGRVRTREATSVALYEGFFSKHFPLCFMLKAASIPRVIVIANQLGEYAKCQTTCNTMLTKFLSEDMMDTYQQALDKWVSEVVREVAWNYSPLWRYGSAPENAAERNAFEKQTRALKVYKVSLWSELLISDKKYRSFFGQLGKNSVEK